MPGKTLADIKAVLENEEYSGKLGKIHGISGLGTVDEEDKCRLRVCIDTAGPDPEGDIFLEIKEEVMDRLKGSGLKESDIIFEIMEQPQPE